MKEILTQLGIAPSFLIAGLIGAIAGATGSKKPLLTRIGSIFMGVGCSVFLTPLACELASITNEQSKMGIAVVIGYLGIQGIQTFIISKLKKDANT